MGANILIVDDEAAIRRALERFLGGIGYQAWGAGTGEEALKLMNEQIVDVALVDLVMPEMDGIELIKRMKSQNPQMVAIVMTAFGTITSAVEAMKVGAYHYLTKPFELDDIASLIKTSLEHRKLKEENRYLRQQLKAKYKFENIVGDSEEMERIFELVERVSDTDSTVLVLGESGTGKELIARAIHYNSNRAEKPLVTVNCAAIPEELLESELFGHMKGSYTGAYSTRPGKFDVADTGTIFLDEIGDMSPKLQVKMLRVLQERRFEPVGSTKSHEVDVRIITATNQDLEIGVKEGRFREDLYYRLNVIPINVPPLRERKNDVPLLLNHFLQKFNVANQRQIEGFSKDAMEVLVAYPWPGNVRELENFVERLVILKGAGLIEKSDLPPPVSGVVDEFKSEIVNIPDIGISFKDAVSEFENELILKALEKTNWNKNKAASLLQLNRTTLVEKMKKKKLDKFLQNGR